MRDHCSHYFNLFQANLLPCQPTSSADDFGQTDGEPGLNHHLLPGLNSLPSPDAPVGSFTHPLCYVLSNMGLELPFSSDLNRTEHAVFLIKI